jgi:hypothetical protein
MGGVKQFVLVVVASVAATLLSTYLVNNVRQVRRIVGSL